MASRFVTQAMLNWHVFLPLCPQLSNGVNLSSYLLSFTGLQKRRGWDCLAIPTWFLAVPCSKKDAKESCSIFLFREESEVALGLSTAFRSLAEILAAFWVKK